MSAPLFLLRIGVDAQRLYSFIERSSTGRRDFDEGYAIHALFAALFDHRVAPETRVAPKPFHVGDAMKRTLDVLGYGAHDHHMLAERAKAFGDPLAWGICDVTRMASKPMPTSFPAATKLGFTVRVCPVRRIAKRGPMTRERAEVDAFLARSWEAPEEPLDREEVYRSWLDAEFAKEGAAQVLRAKMTSFRLGSLHRRTHGENRTAHATQRPDATFEGVLEVGEAASFMRLLARGVGRHRSFGFGMLLLSPPSRIG